MELQLSPDQTLLVLGILFAVAVGFLIPRKPAEDFIEWVLQDMERNPHSHRYRLPVGVILLALIIGLGSEYSYGVIGLLIGFAINFGLFVFWR